MPEPSSPKDELAQIIASFPGGQEGHRIRTCNLGLGASRSGRLISAPHLAWALRNAVHSLMCGTGRPKTGSCPLGQPTERGLLMLWTIAVILLVLWLLGLVTGYTLGGFIHILLVIAVIVVIVRIIQGRRAV